MEAVRIAGPAPSTNPFTKIIETIQSGWSGCPTGNRKKLSSSQAKLWSGKMLGSCLVSFYFLWAILSTSTVYLMCLNHWYVSHALSMKFSTFSWVKSFTHDGVWAEGIITATLLLWQLYCLSLPLTLSSRSFEIFFDVWWVDDTVKGSCYAVP